MRKLAIENTEDRKNVVFKKGRAESIPLEDNSVDMTVAVTAAFSYNEAKRITKMGGYVVAVNVAPRWYGGELASVILGRSRKTYVDVAGGVDIVLTDLGFEYRDFYTVSDYQTVDKAVETYGFIFGKKAIEYLWKHHKTTIKWKFRIHYREI